MESVYWSCESFASMRPTTGILAARACRGHASSCGLSASCGAPIERQVGEALLDRGQLLEKRPGKRRAEIGDRGFQARPDIALSGLDEAPAGCAERDDPAALILGRGAGFDQAEIDQLDQKAQKTRARSLKHDWKSPNFSAAFANVEIQYRRPGETELRVHRHIGWNLGDPYLRKHPELIRHLETKGTVTMLTKGASYLLWRGDFSLIRNYMLDHLAWMLSDSTGIPPAFAHRAGMVQITYGRYDGAFLEGTDTKHDDAFIDLWKSQKTRRLPFRFGYVDMNKQAHLVVTRPKS